MTTSRSVRVFLSSTFRDFSEERDLLVRKVFPELRRRARERNVEVIDIDLRWGITPEQAERGEVLPICLAEIDRARPYFFGFIGDRYGWVPEANQYDLSLLVEQPWVKEHRGGKSVTELEMLHGVLNNPAMAGRAFFYFRDTQYSQAKGGAYLSESEEHRAKLHQLKTRIRESGFPVMEDYPSPEILAEQVQEDLWRLIDEAFPMESAPDPVTLERRKHEVYGGSRLGLYLGGERYFVELDEALAADPFKQVLITGPSGGGKSALVANWVERHARAHPDAWVITHYLGSSADAADPVRMVYRIEREIAQVTGAEDKLEGDPNKILQHFPEWLSRASAFGEEKGRDWILVLDGMDKLSARKELYWWPSEMPSRVKIVASCLDGDIQSALKARMKPCELMVHPLSVQDGCELIRTYLARFNKVLPEPFVERIVAHPLGGSPMFLRIVAEEMRVFGVHEHLQPRLGSYLESGSMGELFAKVFDRIEEDNKREDIETALSVLWGALESFAEDELIAVTGLAPAVWSSILNALEGSLISNGGRIAFGHDYLRKAVEDRYVASSEKQNALLRRLADFCAERMRIEGRNANSSYVRRQAVRHFIITEQWDESVATLSDLEFIEARAKAKELSEMQIDYARTLKFLPEGMAGRMREAARHEALDNYAMEMMEYGVAWTRIREGSCEAAPKLPSPLASVHLWSIEEITADIKRITESPNREEVVKAFSIFVATNSNQLEKYSQQEGFAANLARNEAPAGPVHMQGEKLLQTLNCIKLIKRFASNETYTPFPACQRILDGHQDGVAVVKMSSDGKVIASGSYDGTVRIWCVESGACLKQLAAEYGAVHSLALRSDGKQLVSGGSKVLRIWDIESGECLHTLQGHEDLVYAVAFSPDGQYIASGCRSGTLRLWHSDRGVWLKTFRTSKGSITDVQFSADGNKLISAGYNIDIWDPESEKHLNIIKGHKEIILSIALSASGNSIISGSEDNTIGLWDTVTGQCLAKLSGHSGPVSAVLFSSDEKLIISGSRDQTIRVWDMGTRACLAVLRGHEDWIFSLAASADFKTIVSASWDHTIRIWNIEKSAYFIARRGHKKSVRCLSYTPDGRYIASGGEDEVVKIWDREERVDIQSLEGHRESIHGLEFSPDAKTLISASQDKAIILWNLENGKILKKLQGHKNWINAIKLDANATHLVSGDLDSKVIIWDVASGVKKSTLKASDSGGTSISVRADNKQIALSAGNVIQIWETGSLKDTVKIDTGEPINSVVFSCDGKLIFVRSLLNSIQIFDSSTGSRLKYKKEGPYSKDSELPNRAMLQFYPLELSCDNKVVIHGNWDDTIRIWNPQTNQSVVFFLRGLSTYRANWSGNSLACGYFDGRVDFFEFENLRLGSFFTTAAQQLTPEASEASGTDLFNARPACCGQLISVPPFIAKRIEYWSLDGGESGYTDPTLQMPCPHCKTPLRMNPFFVSSWPR